MTITKEEPPRVVVVDDDPAFGGMIAEVLRDKGYDAHNCTSPNEALDRLTKAPVAVLIVDLVMPVLTGIEVADKAKGLSPETQVVVLTGHGDMQSAIDGIKHGVFDYLQKSAIDIPRLTRSVSAAAQRWRLLGENRGLMAQLREHNLRLATLHEMTERISAEAHLDRLLSELANSARTLARAELARVILFDHTPGERFVVEQAIGDGADSLQGVRVSLGEGIATRVFERGVAEVSAQPARDPQYSDRIDLVHPFQPGLVCAPLKHGRIRGVLLVAGRKDGAFDEGDREVLAILARHAAVAADNAQEHEQGTNFFTHTSNLLVQLLEGLDIHYPGHSRNVARLADMITRRLGLGDTERRNIHFAALLHDIGKLLVPVEILKIEEHLSPAQSELLRTHPSLALDLLKPITAWQEMLPMIHAHHERWDGKGYPLRTAGDAIPLGARVIAVADAFDAMTKRRAHGARKSEEAALAELEAFAGTQFDPKIVRLFVAEYRQTELGA